MLPELILQIVVLLKHRNMNLSINFLIISAIWVASEIVLTRLMHSRASDSKLDKHSLRVLWVTIIVCVTVGNVIGVSRIGHISMATFIISLTGISLIIAGLIIRWIAIITLKKYFTVDVAINKDHELIQSGIYKFIRHPAYSGSALSFLGLGVAFSNWMTIIVIFGPILLAFLYRIRVEERALIDHFGDRYYQYCKKTKRLVPLIY